MGAWRAGRTEELLSIVEELVSFHDSPSYALTTSLEALHAHGHAGASMNVQEVVMHWFESRPAEEKETRRHRFHYARILLLVGQSDDARRLLEALAQEYTEDMEICGYLGFIAATSGQTALANQYMATVVEGRSTDPVTSTYWRGVITGALGDSARAVALLSQSFNEGRSFFYDEWTRTYFEPLRDYTPWQELMRPKG